MSKNTVEQVFTRIKVTKNFIHYGHVDNQTGGPTKNADIIGNLYIRKELLGDIGVPETVKVTVIV